MNSLNTKNPRHVTLENEVLTWDWHTHVRFELDQYSQLELYRGSSLK